MNKNSFFLIMFFAGLYLLYSSRECIKYKLTPFPSQVAKAIEQKQIDHVVFLFGESICSACPSGAMLESFQDEETLFIVDKDYNQFEVQNFLELFHIVGEAIWANDQTISWLHAFVSCKTKDDFHKNFVMRISDNSVVLDVQLL